MPETRYNSDGNQIPEPPSAPARWLAQAVRFYQTHVSSLKMVSTCRFEPTCSAYALEAVSRHGALRGSGLALARIFKCGPWYPGGYDPVPGATRPPASTRTP